MDIRSKIISALNHSMNVDYVRLEADDGITGFVVSPDFKEMSSLDRQDLIDQALSKSAPPLSPKEQRQILMIAGISPEEYDTVGSRIRIHRIKELAQGRFRILLHGNLTDAEYVRSVLDQSGNVKTTTPKSVSGALGILLSFSVEGVDETLTKAHLLQILKADRYLDVLADA